ncbi:AI-2E family transporter [Clostridium tertium]|uniref:Pheromone autoinducer 2 transporter n=1 Tax=Clostridium tertium TaxID=1559 RepID=A0A6N2Z735_9CLOT
MKLYNTYSKIINLVLLFIIISAIAILINKYFKPFFIIIIFMLLTQPIFKVFNRLNLSKKISAVLSIFFLNALLFIIIFYFGNRIISFVYMIYNNNLNDFLEIFNSIKVFLNLDIDKIIKSLSGFFDSKFIMQGAMLTGDGIVSYFLANIISYFILVDKNEIMNFFMKLFPKEFTEGFFKKLLNLKEVFKIEIRLIILSGIIVTIGFRVLSIENSLFLGTISAILDILPFVGTTIVFIPIIIYNIVMKRFLLVFGLVLLYFLEKVIREILEAKFLSSRLEIHPLVVILSIYIGVNMFGLIGIIVGPIYSIIAKDVIYSS